MSVVSVAIIGRNNEPLFLREFGEAGPLSENDNFGISQADNASSSDDHCSIRQQFILKEALERLDYLDIPGFFWRTASATGTDGKCFVGMLFPVEDLRVYGA
jgi:hypothetical protein